MHATPAALALLLIPLATAAQETARDWYSSGRVIEQNVVYHVLVRALGLPADEVEKRAFAR
jgi:protein-disulfide isomerase-like protein with CxxC motif